MPHQRRQKAETFPPTRHPHRSSEQDIDQEGLCPVRSFPRAEHSPYLDQGSAALDQQPTASNLESNIFTNHGQVANARDASLQALWPLSFKILNSVSSLQGDLADWCAATLSQGPSFGLRQETSLDAGISEEELVQIVLEQPRLSNDNETNERDNRLFEYHALCASLLQAALKGDWQFAKALLEKHPYCVRARITKDRGTALHNAAAASRTNFVNELVKLMTPDDLELKTKEGCTALIFAVQSGIVGIAEEMVKKNPKLPLICDRYGRTPLEHSAWQGHRKMASYLLSVTPLKDLSPRERIHILVATISSDMYDIALTILKMDRTVATAETSNGSTALLELAKKPSVIGSKSQLSVWEKRLNSWFEGICNKALMQTSAHQLVDGLWKEVIGLLTSSEQVSSNLVHNHMNLLLEAAKVGNIEFLIILIRSSPDLIWQVDENKGSLFHVAVLNRQESVFNLIYEVGILQYNLANFIDKNDNNMLHLAGQLPPSDRLNIVSGAALQMQRELLWFKEIEKIVPPFCVTHKNLQGETPRDIFIRTHKELQKDGEKWMKDTANSCMLVATLITTVVFTAAFTIPGGNNQETGTPIFLESNWFMVFFISDVIAMLSSSTSILVFLSILTSRYTEKDFLKSLPARLVFGLTTLFVSIVFMVVAFSATCFLVYHTKTTRVIPIIIIVSAGIPIILFVVLHYDLWFDIIRSTYWSKFLFRPRKHGLFSLGREDNVYGAIAQYKI